MGSVIAMRTTGIKYACQTGSRAPANRLIEPTGAKFGGCGIRRAIAPRTVRDKATGRQFDLFINQDYRPCRRLRDIVSRGGAQVVRSIRVAAVFVLALRLWAGDANLNGRVVDENDAPIAGALVSLRPADSASSYPPSILHAVADPTGAFMIVLPQSGSYLVTVNKSGMFPLTDRPAELKEGKNEIVLVLNHVHNTSEAVNVTAAVTPIDVDQTSAESRLLGTQILEVPYPATHNLRNALPLLPGIVTGPAGDLHFNGGAENQVQYTLDGFNISDPLTGTFQT